MLLTPQGTPDYTFETVNGQQVRKQKVNRPKALCFDYSLLKQEFGLTLETEVMTEAEEISEDATATDAETPAPPKPQSLFSSAAEEDMPF